MYANPYLAVNEILAYSRLSAELPSFSGLGKSSVAD